VWLVPTQVQPDVAALVGLVRCPVCGAAVRREGDELVCTGADHLFPVVEGVGVLIGEETLAADPQYASQRRYFDAEFAGYAGYRLERWRVSYLRRLEAAGVLTGDGPLVDVGVGGSGYTVIEAARRGRLAVGCDLSLEGLVRARRAAIAEGVAERTLWLCCSAERLPLASASFGAVLAVAVIEHVPDDGAALAEAARLLRPGGRLWVTVPHALGKISPVFRLPNAVHDRRLGHLRRYDASGLADAAGRAGFSTLDVQFTGHPVKVAQLAAQRLPGKAGNRFWWWCEERDLRRRRHEPGSMQLSMLFERS
jgi:SAM-dependent methyltransferase